MMYVTGDTHSDFFFFFLKKVGKQKEVEKRDYVGIFRDF